MSAKRFRTASFILAFAVAGPFATGSAARADCRWRLFPTVNLFPTGNQLDAVSGTSENDVWEAGASFGQHRSSGYALHWNGRAWHAFAQSDPRGHGGQFSGIAALHSDDVWFVGQVYAMANYRSRIAVAEHWGGARFTRAPLPGAGSQETFLYGVAANGPADVWAAGGAQAAGGLQHSYVVHWDGRSWSRSAAVDLPNVATNLDAVARTSASDVWVVGGSRASTSAPFRTLAEHWDGRRWSVVTTPNVNAASNVFNAVVALAPDDVWAVGDYANGKAFSPLAEHWDGTAWSIVPTPDSGTHNAFIFGAAAVSPDEVWAVGEIATTGPNVATDVLRWDGVRWTQATSPNAPHQLVTLFNGAAAIPGGATWAVGGTANKIAVIHTVTEIHACRKEDSIEDR